MGVNLVSTYIQQSIDYKKFTVYWMSQDSQQFGTEARNEFAPCTFSRTASVRLVVLIMCAGLRYTISARLQRCTQNRTTVVSQSILEFDNDRSSLFGHTFRSVGVPQFRVSPRFDSERIGSSQRCGSALFGSGWLGPLRFVCFCLVCFVWCG